MAAKESLDGEEVGVEGDARLESPAGVSGGITGSGVRRRTGRSISSFSSVLGSTMRQIKMSSIAQAIGGESMRSRGEAG